MFRQTHILRTDCSTAISVAHLLFKKKKKIRANGDVSVRCLTEWRGSLDMILLRSVYGTLCPGAPRAAGDNVIVCDTKYGVPAG